MSPPQVNKYYAVDLSPDKSLIKWAVDSGVQMFVVSWRNPTVEQRHWSLEDYAMALDRAVDVALQITGSPTSTLGHLLGRHDAGGLPAAGPRGATTRSPTRPGRSACSTPASAAGLAARAVQLAGDDPRSQGEVTPQGLRQRRRDGVDVRLAASERPDLELLGQQLPARQQAAGLRHPGLERRHDPAARPVPLRPARSGREEPVRQPIVNDDGTLGERNDVRCASIEHKLGIHASPTAVLAFGDGPGAIGYLLGEENRGLETMFIMMNEARFGVGVQGRQ
jgi:hypothetical protein